MVALFGFWWSWVVSPLQPASYLMCLGYEVKAQLKYRLKEKQTHTQTLVIPCAPKSAQQSAVKAGLRLYNAWKWPLFEVRFLTRIRFFQATLASLKDAPPVYRKYAPCLCHTVALVFSSPPPLVNLTWFQFSSAPLGTVKIAFCVQSSELDVGRTAVMSVHVCIFSRGRWGLALASPPFIFGGWLTGFGNGSVNTPCHQLSHCTFP